VRKLAPSIEVPPRVRGFSTGSSIDRLPVYAGPAGRKDGIIPEAKPSPQSDDLESRLKPGGQRIVVIGAGPAGLAAGCELAKGGRPGFVLEKDSVVGGLCQTARIGPYLSDLGPHRMLLRPLPDPASRSDLLPLELRGKLFVRGRHYDYPVDLLQVLASPLGPRVVCDYLLQQAKNLLGSRRRCDTLESAAVSRFGWTLANLRFLMLVETLYGVPASRLAAEWARPYLRSRSLSRALRESLLRGSRSSGLQQGRLSWVPRDGTGSWYRRHRDIIEQGNGRVILNSTVKDVVCDRDRVLSVVYQVHDRFYELPVQGLISSAPLPVFLSLLRPQPPDDVLRASCDLTYRNVLFVFLQGSRPHLTRGHWILYPERQCPFDRVMEPRNWSEDFAPPENSSLMVEYNVSEGSSVWQLQDDELIDLTQRSLAGLRFPGANDMPPLAVIRRTHAYPVLTRDYLRALQVVNAYLARFANLRMAGAAGTFQYLDQVRAAETGAVAARGLLDQNPALNSPGGK
jgi:protoporphyrinogen oxidase